MQFIILHSQASFCPSLQAARRTFDGLERDTTWTRPFFFAVLADTQGFPEPEWKGLPRHQILWDPDCFTFFLVKGGGRLFKTIPGTQALIGCIEWSWCTWLVQYQEQRLARCSIGQRKRCCRIEDRPHRLPGCPAGTQLGMVMSDKEWDSELDKCRQAVEVFF